MKTAVRSPCFIIAAALGLTACADSSCESTLGAISNPINEDELELYNGRGSAATETERSILLALSGVVYDVSSGPYKPGDQYAAFAGRACTRGVALPSLKPEDIHDDISDFTEAQLASVDHWNAFFREKYAAVSVLRGDTASERAARLARHAQAKRKSDNANNEAMKAARAAAVEAATAKIFTLDELSQHDGTVEGRPILLALGGHVVDVSKSAYLYGPAKPRACYAGHDVTRISALQGAPGVTPCDAGEIGRGADLGGLTAAQLGTLKKRLDFFLGKFPIVGVLADSDLLEP